MEAAEGGRAHYRRIADRVSALYSPVVHLTAFVDASLAGWLATGDWHRAMTIAIAVLIITCPCALGLAVPIVQVVAARRLFENGIMVKDGSAMERLAEIDTVGVRQDRHADAGQPRLRQRVVGRSRMLAMAADLAAHSRHPFSKAIGRFPGFCRTTEDGRRQRAPRLRYRSDNRERHMATWPARLGRMESRTGGEG